MYVCRRQYLNHQSIKCTYSLQQALCHNAVWVVTFLLPACDLLSVTVWGHELQTCLSVDTDIITHQLFVTVTAL